TMWWSNTTRPIMTLWVRGRRPWFVCSPIEGVRAGDEAIDVDLEVYDEMVPMKGVFRTDYQFHPSAVDRVAELVRGAGGVRRLGYEASDVFPPQLHDVAVERLRSSLGSVELVDATDAL